MKCPYCGFYESKVADSRSAEEGKSIRRRRECLHCTRRFTTYEVIEEIPLMVIKKDGRREMFDRSKILNGLVKACEKRSVPLQRLEQITSDIEKDIRNAMEREFSSQVVGEKVMDNLRKLDEVAYVRFASVYRQFTDINKFMQELEALVKRQS